MAIKTDTNSMKFHSGKGDVSAKVAKSNEEVIHEEAEVIDLEAEAIGSDKGERSEVSGAKPVFATGENPFHEGRGLGRGHGPETAKNA